MKIDFIVISLILVMLVLLPFILLPLIQNSDRKKLLKKFNEESLKHNLNLDQKELWSLNAIGIDSAQGILLWIQKIEDIYVSEFVDLSSVKATEFFVVENKKKINGKPETVLEKIDVEFLYFDGKIKNLNFFNYELHVSQDLEKYHAEKWYGIVQKQINQHKHINKSA